MSTEQTRNSPPAPASSTPAAPEPKIVIFVGGSSGLGFAALEYVLKRGKTSYKVILGSRSDLAPEQMATLKPLLEKSRSTLKRIDCDLARYESVKSFANAIISDHPEDVDVLVLCAGMVGGTRRDTADGVEETLQVNMLSQALLIDMLIPKIGNATEKARILFVGSALHRKVLPGTLTPANLNERLLDYWDPMDAYQVTKFLLMYLFFFTHDRAVSEKRNISAVAVSPGFVPQTGLSRELGVVKNFFMQWVAPQMPFTASLEEGAQTIAKGIEEDIPSGTYFSKRGPGFAAEEIYDEKLRAQWREWLIAQGVWETARQKPPTMPVNTFAPPGGPPPTRIPPAKPSAPAPAATPSPVPSAEKPSTPIAAKPSPSEPTPSQVEPVPVAATKAPEVPPAGPSPTVTPSPATPAQPKPAATPAQPAVPQAIATSPAGTERAVATESPAAKDTPKA